FCGQSVSLELPALVAKLIHGGRGGYCFEHNLLLRQILLQLGFQVTNLAARVRWNIPDDVLTARRHMLLLVHIDGQAYIADVGFGGLGLTAPLRLVADRVQETGYEPMRLRCNGDTYLVQVRLGAVWKSLYSFDLQEQLIADYEVTNWYLA